MANNVTNQYGFDLSLKSDYWNKSPNSSNVWKNIGDYSGLSGVPFGSFDSTSKSNSREDALSKAANWLAGTGRTKYTSQTQRSGQSSFMPQSGGGSTGGGSWQQVAPDISVFNPAQQGQFTTPGGQAEASWGQKLGGAALAVAPFTGPAAPIVAGVGAITSLF